VQLPASQKLLAQVGNKMTSEEIVQAKRTRNELLARLTPAKDGTPER
jgi:hypothetical protein